MCLLFWMVWFNWRKATLQDSRGIKKSCFRGELFTQPVSKHNIFYLDCASLCSEEKTLSLVFLSLEQMGPNRASKREFLLFYHRIPKWVRLDPTSLLQQGQVRIQKI